MIQSLINDANNAVSLEVMLIEAERQIDELKMILENERKLHLKIAMKAEHLHRQLHARILELDQDQTPEDMSGIKEIE